MYCVKCGTKNVDGAKFCVHCGQALGIFSEEVGTINSVSNSHTSNQNQTQESLQQTEGSANHPEMNTAARAIKNKRKNKRTFLIIGGVVLLVFLGFVGKQLFIPNTNPLALILDGVKSYETLPGFDFQITAEVSDDKAIYEGSIAPGKDLDSSLFSVSSKSDNHEESAYFADGIFAYNADDGDYFDIDDLTEDSEYELVNDELAAILTDKNGIDIPKLYDDFDDSYRGMVNTMLKNNDLDARLPEAENIVGVINDFFYRYCSQRKIKSELFTSIKKTRSKGYQFEINAQDLLVAITNYFKDMEDNDKLLKKYDLEKDDISLVNNFLEDDVENQLNYDLDKAKCEITVELDSKNRFKLFSIKIPNSVYGRNGSTKITANFSNYGKPSLKKNKVREEIEAIQDLEDEYYDDDYEW